MRKFSDFVVQYRVLVVLVTLGVTALLGYHLKDLRIDSDILNYLPEEDPAVVLFHEVGDRFGGNSMAMVALETEDVFNYGTLRRINLLTERLKGVEGLSHVMSLTDILDIKRTEWGLEVGKLIDKHRIPEDPEALSALRNYTLSKEMFVGRLVSADGKVALIICRIKEGYDKVKAGEKIERIVEEMSPPEKVYYAGIPFQMRAIHEIVSGDLRVLIPLVSLLLILTLYFSFRSFYGVLFPLATVFLSSLWTVGLMGMLNIPMTIISNITPVILIAVGSAYGIHMVSRFDEEMTKGLAGPEGVRGALSEVGVPILLAGLTTLVGFVSFTGSYLRMVRDFGIFTGIGVFFAMFISTTFIPALLSYVSPRRAGRHAFKERNDAITRVMDRLGAFVLRRERALVAAGVVVSLVALAGLPRIKREVNMLEYFGETSDVRISEDMMEEKFGGSLPFQISVRGDIKDPAVLKEMAKVEKYLETFPYVGKPQSIADLIAEMNDVMNGRRRIPDTREGVANLWFFLEGEEVMDQLVSPDTRWALIQANLATVNTAKIIELVDRTGSFLSSRVDSSLIAVDLAEIEGLLKSAAVKEQANRIVDLVELDFRRYISDGRLPEDLLRERVLQALSGARPQFSQELLSEQSRRIHDYFESGDADVAVESEQGIEQIASGLSEMMVRGNHSKSDIAGLVRRAVDEKALSEDPEALEYTAEFLANVLDQTEEQARVQILLAETIPLFPQSLRENETFLKDLRDDLWAVNERRVPLSASRCAELLPDAVDPIRISALQTGLPLIFKHLDENLVSTQIRSLILAVGVVFLILAFQFRSLAGGLIGVTPIVLTILVNFGTLSYLNIPLDVATVLVGSIAIGVGIDYTIHFLSRFRTEFGEGGRELDALDRTLETTGRAILINALSVMLGFLALLAASIVPLQRFGWLTGLTMIVSALGAMTILPALILVSKAKFVRRKPETSQKEGSL